MAEPDPTDTVKTQLDDLEESVVEKTLTTTKERLSDFGTAIERIPSPEPPPRTTLQLQGRAGSEGAWQNYLEYFLDPSSPHGLGTDALNRFLRGINRHVNKEIPTYVPDTVEVVAESRSDAGNQPDLVIHCPGRFFICCELKLYSREGDNQTQRYIEDTQAGQTNKRDFPEDGHHYLYIKRPGHKDAEAEGFVNITWKQIHSWLEPLLSENRGRYPSRTTAQLSDYLDTIHQDMTEDEYLRTEREKMELYFNHEASINEAIDGLETVYQHEKENWRRNFIEGYLPDTWSEDWHCNPDHNGQFYHSKWRQDDSLAIADADIRLHFVHLIRNIECFKEGKLTVQLRWPGSSRYRDRFKQLFISDRFADELDPVLGKHDIQKLADYSYNNPRFTEKVYSVVKTDLPGSYYETLSQAVKEHQELAPVINDMLTTAVRDVEE